MILVLRALGIGDLLTAVPALRGLRHRFPDERVVLAAPEGLRDLVELIGEVDALVPTPGPDATIGVDARPRLAVNLHGRGPQSIAALERVRPHRMLTHRHPEHPGREGPQWQDGDHETARWCRLLQYDGIAADPGDLRLSPPKGTSPAPRAVVVHPGAGSPARRWPPGRYARVARSLADGGHRVVVSGSGAERELAARVAGDAGLPAGRVLAGGLDLAGLARLVADARLVICGDTGVGHLATAFGTDSVLLFGPTPPREWGPSIDVGRHTVLWTGDVGDPHASRPDPGLLLLSHDRVRRAAERALARGPVIEAGARSRA